MRRWKGRDLKPGLSPSKWCFFLSCDEHMTRVHLHGCPGGSSAPPYASRRGERHAEQGRGQTLGHGPPSTVTAVRRLSFFVHLILSPSRVGLQGPRVLKSELSGTRATATEPLTCGQSKLRCAEGIKHRWTPNTRCDTQTISGGHASGLDAARMREPPRRRLLLTQLGPLPESLLGLRLIL